MKDDKSLHGNKKYRKPISSRFRSIISPAFHLSLLLLSFFLGYFISSSSFFSSDDNNSSSATTTTSAASHLGEPVPLPTQLDNFLISSHCADPLPIDLIPQTLVDRIFNGTSPFEDFPPPHVANALRHRSLKGWGSKLPVFKNLIDRVRPKVIIEVGTFLGASTVHMANLARGLGLHDTIILCIDDFRGWPGFEEDFPFIKHVNGDNLLLYQFMQNAVHTNVSDSVLPVPFSSSSSLSKLCEWGITADLIEIDAGHGFNSVWSDINNAYRLLRPGGVMFGHDYFLMKDNRAVRRAVNLFAQIYGLQVETDGEHWVLHTS
ncbi:hypothetical protein LINGRAHAP2_LOCUS34097 [Linum grandiflorum]